MNRDSAHMLAAELAHHPHWRVGCTMMIPDGGNHWFVTVQSRHDPERIEHLHTLADAVVLIREDMTRIG